MAATNLNLNIVGFPVVNNDLEVDIIDPSRPDRPIVRDAKPFRDGTLNAKIPPGAYDIVIRHPQLFSPVIRRPIRILPTGETKIQILIDPSKFKNTPIADVPDANLQPVIDAATGVEDDARALGNKVGGEAILAGHWNEMAGGVETLGRNLAELARLTAPIGHNHPEYEAKLNELATNFDTLVNTLSASMAEIQRRLQVERLESHAQTLLDTVNPTQKVVDARKKVGDIVDKLNESVTDPPRAFSDLLRTASDDIQRIVREATEGGGEPKAKENFEKLTTEMQLAQPAKDFTTELVRYQKLNRQFGLTKRNLQP